MELKLQPTYKISGAGNWAGIESVVLRDNSGFRSDSVEILVNHHDVGAKNGENIEVHMGYVDDLYNMGVFSITAIKPMFFPSKTLITATATALHINSPAKLRRSESYAGKTLEEIAQAVAGRLGVGLTIHNDLKQKVIVYIDQKNESDIAFIERLSSYYDAVAKVIDGTLIFAPRGQVKAVSGQPMPSVDLVIASSQSAPYNGIQDLSVTVPERYNYLGVKADWIDTDSAEIHTEKVGDAPFNTLPGRYATQGEAANAAAAELSKIKRQSIRATIAIPGNPNVMAETIVNINGAGELIDGDWSCDSVVHDMSMSGYKTLISASGMTK